MTTFLLALASIAVSVAAQFLLKAGMTRVAVAGAGESGSLTSLLHAIAEPRVLGGFALYGAGAVIWLLVLARWDVSKAYPLVGLGFVATLVVGLVLGEAVGPWRAIGVLMIVAGVWIVANS